MDTKSKNKLVFFTVFVATSIFLALAIISGADIIKNRSYFNKSYYFNSIQFKSEAANYLRSAIRLAIETDKESQEYINLKKYIDSRPALKYYIVFNSGKSIYTNIKDSEDINNYIKENALYSLKLPAYIIGDTEYPEVNYWFKSTNSEGYIIVLKNIQGYNEIIEGNNYYLSIRQRVIKEAWICDISALLFLIVLMIMKKSGMRLCGIKDYYKKFPFDIRCGLFLCYTGAMVFYIANMSFFYKPVGIDQGFKLVLTSLYSAFLLLNACSLPKTRNELKSEWKMGHTYQYYKKVAKSYASKGLSFKVRIVVISTIVFGCSIVLFTLSIDNTFSIFSLIIFAYLLIYLLIIPRYISSNAKYINKIIQGTEAIALGDLNYSIEEKNQGNFKRLAENINNMRKNFKNSIESEMKSERLKTELITNVSHDLKTPLTSIINYIDLLKRESLTDAERKEYVAILEKKSHRLKVIIEDLFEVSKITSGSIELNIERLDVIFLLNQSLAEFDERIKNSSLEFKINYPENKVYLNLDGKKTWRVFENLIGNIIKYSQKNTRVYINVIQGEDRVAIIMKNISAYELNFDVDEIFERFKRGDQSRTTEGSGLGLAIAKSIVELEGGRLTIEIDGDLFKSIIEFKI